MQPEQPDYESIDVVVPGEGHTMLVSFPRGLQGQYPFIQVGDCARVGLEW